MGKIELDGLILYKENIEYFIENLNGKWDNEFKNSFHIEAEKSFFIFSFHARERLDGNTIVQVGGYDKGLYWDCECTEQIDCIPTKIEQEFYNTVEKLQIFLEFGTIIHGTIDITLDPHSAWILRNNNGKWDLKQTKTHVDFDFYNHNID
jgi:hypothetical protein